MGGSEAGSSLSRDDSSPPQRVAKMDRVVSHPPSHSIPGSGPGAKGRVSSLPGTGGTGAVGISKVQSKKAVAVTGGIASAPNRVPMRCHCPCGRLQPGAGLHGRADLCHKAAQPAVRLAAVGEPWPHGEEWETEGR